MISEFAGSEKLIDDFIEDPPGFPSDVDFAALSTNQKADLMRDWFFHNFADPVHEMPYNSREGGYQYIYGGPYDPDEELQGRFGYDEVLLAAAIDLISEQGYEFAASPRRNALFALSDNYDPDDDYEVINGGEINGPSLPQDEASARHEVELAVARLDALLGGVRSVTRSHNNPPELIEQDRLSEAIDGLTESVREINGQLSSKKPSKSAIQGIASSLKSIVAIVGVTLLTTAIEKNWDKIVSAAGDVVDALLKWSNFFV